MLQQRLRLTADAEGRSSTTLQKDVDARLEKILDDEQKAQLKEMRERGPGGPRGGPGGGGLPAARRRPPGGPAAPAARRRAPRRTRRRRAPASLVVHPHKSRHRSRTGGHRPRPAIGGRVAQPYKRTQLIDRFFIRVSSVFHLWLNSSSIPSPSGSSPSAPEIA